MDREQQLREEHEAVAQRVRDKEDEYQAAEVGLSALVGELLASTNGQRETLINRRAVLVATRDALRDEIVELQRRRALARLAVHEYRESVARAEAERLRVASSAARVALNVLMDRLRAARNTGADVIELGNIEADLARTRAGSLLATRDLERAKVRHERTIAEVERVRTELGISSELQERATA